jgi:hypothetical protein
MRHKLERLKDKIANGDFPKNFEHFGGANLIITDDKNRNHYFNDIVVFSENAGSLSWLVYELKQIFNSELDYMNKYGFYTNIGNLMNSCINEGLNLKDTMIFVINDLKNIKI